MKTSWIKIIVTIGLLASGLFLSGCAGVHGTTETLAPDYYQSSDNPMRGD